MLAECTFDLVVPVFLWEGLRPGLGMLAKFTLGIVMPVFEGRGNILDCSCCRVMMFLEHSVNTFLL